MGWSEKRGGFWRARWRDPAGKTQSISGFLTEKAADQFWQDQEAAIRANRYIDPRAGQILYEDWVNNYWRPSLGLELSTLANYDYHQEQFILPDFSGRALATIAPEEVDAWELAVAADKSKSTATTARAVLGTCLAAAVPHRIPVNPALRKRATGKKATRRVQRKLTKHKVWATPLEAFLVAERVATLTGRDEDFILVIAIAYTGMRWSEAIGLHPDLVHEGEWELNWKLYELNGQFYRQYPKDGSIRTIDIPPFLDALMASLLDGKPTRCACDPKTEEPFCQGGDYVFLGAGLTHERRSNFSRRFFRPAANGRYPREGGKRPRPARPVLVDVTDCWPGIAVPSVHVEVPGIEGGVFQVPASRGVRRRPELLGVNTRSRREDLVAYAIRHGMTRSETDSLSRSDLLDRFVRASYLDDDPMWGAMWMAAKEGLTPHGLRRAQQTWMAEDRIADVLRDERMGHGEEGDDAPARSKSMRDHYTAITDTMRGELVDSLQKRWEQSLVERVELEGLWHRGDGGVPQSPVSIVNELLKPFRDKAVSGIASRSPRRLQAKGRPRRLASSTG